MKGFGWLYKYDFNSLRRIGQTAISSAQVTLYWRVFCFWLKLDNNVQLMLSLTIFHFDASLFCRLRNFDLRIAGGINLINFNAERNHYIVQLFLLIRGSMVFVYPKI